MTEKIIDWKQSFKSNDELKETVEISEAILHHLLNKLPSTVWFFIPRDKEESMASNSITGMLKLEFGDIDAICLQTGVTYQHKASKGEQKGETLTSFDPKAWRCFDKDNAYQVIQRRPRRTRKTGTSLRRK